MAKNKATRYQSRISKLVWAGNAYAVICPIALLYFGSSVIGWVIYASTATLCYCLAAGFDSVFDSLSERINIQSAWLDVRLTGLESAAHATPGQIAWRKLGVPTNDPSHYFFNFPEQFEE